MPKISIIVPVYNTEKYLHRCVDSILSQTFTDFELLLINDGSTDNSASVCDEYVRMDSRVRVFHKKNGGVSSARNLGLDYALGEWITFVDSDDWLDKQFLFKMYIENISSVDLIISYARYFGKNGEIKVKSYKDCYISSKEIGQLFLGYDLAWQTSPWAKLYKKSKCEDIRFIEGMHIGEDLVFLYTYIMRCDAIYVLAANNYNYDISHDNTLTKRIGRLEEEYYAHDNIYKILEELVLNYRIVDDKILKKINWIKAYYVHRVLNSLYHTPSLSKEQRCRVIGELDIQNYIEHLTFNSYKEQLLRLLLQKKKFRVYDMLRKLVVMIKV